MVVALKVDAESRNLGVNTVIALLTHIVCGVIVRNRCVIERQRFGGGVVGDRAVAQNVGGIAFRHLDPADDNAVAEAFGKDRQHADKAQRAKC